MPLTPKAFPSFWTTSIAKSLSGDQSCLLSTWMGGRFKFGRRNREDAASLALWKANHTEQLQAEVERMRSEGWKVSVEQFFKHTGSTAEISGKADAIANKDQHRPVIVDVKSGQPRESDIIQVAIEVVIIPYAWKREMTFDGTVIYQDHSVPVPYALAEQFKPKIFALLKKLGTSPRPEASPSESACRFCDVPKEECPDRIEEATAEVPAPAEPMEMLF